MESRLRGRRGDLANMGPPMAVSFMEITEGTDSTEKMPPGKSQTKHIAVVKCKRIHLPKQDFFLYATAIFFFAKVLPDADKLAKPFLTMY